MIPGHTIDPYLLLGGNWRPITDTVLFANAPAAQVVDAFLTGLKGWYAREMNGSPLAVTTIPHGSLGGRLENLLPLDSAQDRKVLVTDTANPQWSAIFGSLWVGLDGGHELVSLAKSGIESVLISSRPHRPRAAPPNASYGFREIATYELVPGAEPTAHPHSIRMRAENSRRFEIDGNPEIPFPIGTVWDPTARKVQDRFTHEHLVEMAARYGLRPFDDDFYPEDADTYLVSRTDPDEKEYKGRSLAQARGIEPVPWIEELKK